MSNCRWELGSEFHWLDFDEEEHRDDPWRKNGSFWGSGRDALRALIRHGMSKRGWRRIWMPTYFCQEVVAATVDMGITIASYNDSPLEKELQLALDTQCGDVVFVVNYFGLRNIDSIKLECDGNIDLIEDHTHDPWSNWAYNSRAEYCIASLRKTLPIPEGGVIWSRENDLTMELDVTQEREMAAEKKRSAMLLKRMYLEGKAVDKEIYRELQLLGEEGIGDGDVSGITKFTRTILSIMPTRKWREKRQFNHAYLMKKLEATDLHECFLRSDGNECTFSVLLVAITRDHREKIRNCLIKKNIFPAILWPLEKTVVNHPTPVEHIDLSRRMLSIHCDMRYNESDMEIVGEILEKSWQL